ncbi:FAD-dependent oxidoreductase [bacterium]|nr:FAD-dependent oxidoreductase [bacterium]
MNFELIVFGGGTSGIAAAYIASKYGIKTLLVEKDDVLGGAMTRGLVMPSMKLDTSNINVEFYNDLQVFAKKYNANHKYIDNNDGWFNPELLKIIFDDMLSSVNTTVLFHCNPINIEYDTLTRLFNINLSNDMLSIYIDTTYIIDATSNGKIFKLLNCDFQNDTENMQAASLRFMISGINIDDFADWLEKFDKNRDVTTIDRTSKQIHLSTACTWDCSNGWALTPLFNKAVKNNDLEFEDTAYFQLFTVPAMCGTVNINAPRIILDEDESILDPFVYSRALLQGRERIYRLFKFCKKYLPGFENCYISHISDMLGVRESYRVKCKYTYKKDDIINNSNFSNIAFTSNYPIDVHSTTQGNDSLEFVTKTYKVPIETLISDKFDNLYAVGRIISAEFEAQAALRTQRNCFSMGEAAAKDILKKIKRG